MQKITFREELANSLTHGFGVLFGLVAVPALVSFAAMKEDQRYIWGVAIFCATLLMVYLFSTLYHSITHPSIKRVMRIMDHISIYFLIAGTYTPFLLIYVSSPAAGWYLALMWGIALAGTCFKIFLTGKLEILSTLSYLAMGWMVVFIGQPILSGLSTEGLTWLIVGGGAYSLGVIFYVWQKIPYNHAIWHLFVLTGSISHYVAVCYALSSPIV